MKSAKTAQPPASLETRASAGPLASSPVTTGKEQSGLVWDGAQQRWTCTGYREARGILRDTQGRFAVKRIPSHSVLPPTGMEKLAIHLLRPADESLIHKDMRKALAAHFTAEALAPLKLNISDHIEHQLASMPRSGEIEQDLISSFVSPLFLQMTAALLGMPDGDLEHYRAWCQAYLTLSASGSNLFPRDPASASAVYQQHSQYLDEARRYFLVLAYERLAHPRNDLISDLVRILVPEDITDEAQIQMRCNMIAANCLLLLCGGYHMATSLLAAALWWLWKKPAALEMLQRSPALFPVFFDEVLRLGTPYLFLVRQAQQDVMIAGNRVRKAQNIQIDLTAANRDARIYPEPDTFRLERKNRQPSIAFGVGDHMCMGIESIFLLGQLALPAFFQHFPDCHMSEELSWKEEEILRYLPRLACRLAKPVAEPTVPDTQPSEQAAPFAPLVSLDKGMIWVQFPCTQIATVTAAVDPHAGSIALTMQEGKEIRTWAAPLSHLRKTPASLPMTESAEPPKDPRDEKADENAFFQSVYRLLASILEIPEQEVHPGTDFFDAGGDSLAVAALLTALQTQFHLDVDPGIVFDHPRFEDLVATLLWQKQGKHQAVSGPRVGKEATV